MGRIKTLEEAEKWFLENHSGSIRCHLPNGLEKVCATYAEAKEFFNSEDKNSTKHHEGE